MIGLLGSTGYVGRNMANALQKAGVEYKAITDYRMPTFAKLPYDTIINCAGLVDMDRAEIDEDYYNAMIRANAIGPIALRNSFPGYLIHVSSPLAIGEICSRYAVTKQTADGVLSLFPNNTLIVYPNRLYGGDGSQQIDAILHRLLDRKETIDNWHWFNPTPVDAFCDAVVLLMQVERKGKTLIYGRARMTAVEFAREILGIWGERWTEGRYHDVAVRPKDITFDNRFPEYRHVTVEVPLAAAIR